MNRLLLDCSGRGASSWSTICLKVRHDQLTFRFHEEVYPSQQIRAAGTTGPRSSSSMPMIVPSGLAKLLESGLVAWLATPGYEPPNQRTISGRFAGRSRVC